MRHAPTLALIAAMAAAGSYAGEVEIQVLDKQGKPLPDAVVVLYGPAGAAPFVSPLPTVIEQEKMRFIPAVTVVAAGSKLRFTNQDRWDHHVKGAPEAMAALTQAPDALPAGFELRLAGKVDAKPAAAMDVTVDKPGILLLGCHLHGSMRGHVFVTDSAWTLKTDEQGKARFEQVPEGRVQARVWHAEELLEQPRQALQVTAAPLSQTVQLNVVPRRRRL